MLNIQQLLQASAGAFVAGQLYVQEEEFQEFTVQGGPVPTNPNAPAIGDSQYQWGTIFTVNMNSFIPYLIASNKPVPVPTRTQQSVTQQCMNQYNNSAVGKTLKFFSVYNLITDFKNSWLDWTVLPAAKLAILTGTKATSQAVGGTEILSATGGATTTITSPTADFIEAGETLGGKLAGPGIADATAIDIAARANCDANGRQASGQWNFAPG